MKPIIKSSKASAKEQPASPRQLLKPAAAAVFSLPNRFISGRAAHPGEPPSTHLRKLFALAVCQVVMKKDQTFEDIITNRSELWRELGYSRLPPMVVHEKVKNFLDEALRFTWWVRKEVVIVGSSPDTQWESMRWLEKAFYTEGDGSVVLRLHPDLKAHVFRLKGYFTQLYLKAVLALPTSSSIGLYEFLRQYAHRTLGDSWRVELSVLHDVMGIPCDSFYSNSWSKFSDEKLEPALVAINQETDLMVEYEPVKQKGKVVAIMFKVVENRERINSWKRKDQGLIEGQAVPKSRRLGLKAPC
jgi:hypothetical protein